MGNCSLHLSYALSTTASHELGPLHLYHERAHRHHHRHHHHRRRRQSSINDTSVVCCIVPALLHENLHYPPSPQRLLLRPATPSPANAEEAQK
eukprot:3010702-Amphidinium_carterae.1